MREEREDRPNEGRGVRTCENEGCGKPAEGRWCDSCGLEWSLFHREQRSARRAAPERPPQR